MMKKRTKRKRMNIKEERKEKIFEYEKRKGKVQKEWRSLWLVGWLKGISTLVGLFNDKSVFFASSYMVSNN